MPALWTRTKCSVTACGLRACPPPPVPPYQPPPLHVKANATGAQERPTTPLYIVHGLDTADARRAVPKLMKPHVRIHTQACSVIKFHHVVVATLRVTTLALTLLALVVRNLKPPQQ